MYIRDTFSTFTEPFHSTSRPSLLFGRPGPRLHFHRPPFESIGFKEKVEEMNSIGGSHGRLIRDAAELFVTDFTCSASHVQVTQTTECLNDTGSIALEISVFEGPYRGGFFHFCFQIPANYPFRPIEIWAVQPIWHPNIDMKTGRMQIPLEWSPVLTLKSFVIAVQVRTTKSPLIAEKNFH